MTYPVLRPRPYFLGRKRFEVLGRSREADRKVLLVTRDFMFADINSAAPVPAIVKLLGCGILKDANSANLVFLGS